jgi:hypothetical protein
MSANRFRAFLAGLIVLGVLGWLAWTLTERQARISDCMTAYAWTPGDGSSLRAKCEAAERSGRLRDG